MTKHMTKQELEELEKLADWEESKKTPPVGGGKGAGQRGKREEISAGDYRESLKHNLEVMSIHGISTIPLTGITKIPISNKHYTNPPGQSQIKKLIDRGDCLGLGVSVNEHVCDIDLDSKMARVMMERLTKAGVVPRTPYTWGVRQSLDRGPIEISHYLYISDQPVQSFRCGIQGHEFELRAGTSGRAHSKIAPAKHERAGDDPLLPKPWLIWVGTEGPLSPPEIPPHTVANVWREVAAPLGLCLGALANWSPGNRSTQAGWLAGGLYELGLTQEQAEAALTAVVEMAGDEEASNRAKWVASTWSKAERWDGSGRKPYTGLGTAIKNFGLEFLEPDPGSTDPLQSDRLASVLEAAKTCSPAEFRERAEDLGVNLSSGQWYPQIVLGNDGCYYRLEDAAKVADKVPAALAPPKSPKPPVIEGRAWTPGGTVLIDKGKDGLWLNMWRNNGCPVASGEYKSMSDVPRELLEPFFTLVRIIGNNDSRYTNTLLDFLAVVLGSNTLRCQWSPLVIGAGGLGKSTLGNLCEDILAMVHGSRGMRVGTARYADLTEMFSGANGGASKLPKIDESTRLAIFDEIASHAAAKRYHGIDSRVLSQFKTAVTERHLNIKRLYSDETTIPNRLCFLMFSNFVECIQADVMLGERRLYPVLHDTAREAFEEQRPEATSQITARWLERTFGDAELIGKLARQLGTLPVDEAVEDGGANGDGQEAVRQAVRAWAVFRVLEMREHGSSCHRTLGAFLGAHPGYTGDHVALTESIQQFYRKDVKATVNWFEIMARHNRMLGESTDVWPVRLCHQWLLECSQPGPNKVPELSPGEVPADVRRFGIELAKHARERGYSLLRLVINKDGKTLWHRAYVRKKSIDTKRASVESLTENHGLSLSGAVKLVLAGRPCIVRDRQFVFAVDDGDYYETDF